ncbi:hypothetical protein AMAG_02064 [Allomyces macrogynus ATCC 38327]|uniref:Uncharacterized protein n=1 Tax=Allomyces macrogynus (strain ATCC 38327) TaxID=578462 RepID=A0A0L0S1G3_ALLM3|nr:hypothetical protein AMAG_02064 [Allomyces macrogynus ATCC 38327]|eukprot:KNE56231.1 hypothetical protein AMAG_02064 [Allomyces macrogynus ATCC 38327]
MSTPNGTALAAALGQDPHPTTNHEPVRANMTDDAVPTWTPGELLVLPRLHNVLNGQVDEIAQFFGQSKRPDQIRAKLMEFGLAPSRSASSHTAGRDYEPSHDNEPDLAGTPAADVEPAAATASSSALSEDDHAAFVLRFRGFPTQVFPSPGVVEPKAALIANLEDASVLLGRPPGDELLTRLNEAHATRLVDAANSDPNFSHLYHIVASAFVLSQDELAAKVQGLSSTDVQLLREAIEAVYQLSTDASTVTARHVLGRQLQRAHIGTLPPAMQQALVGVPRTDTQLLAPSKDPAIALLNPLRLPKASINKVATILAKMEQDGVCPTIETDKRTTSTRDEDTRRTNIRGRKRGRRVAVIEGVQPPPSRTMRAPLNPLESVAPTPGYAHDASYSRLYSWFAQGAMAPPTAGTPPPPIRSVTAASSSAVAAPTGPLGFASGRVIPPPPPPAPLAAPAPPVPPMDPTSWTSAHRPPISTSYSSYALAQAWQAWQASAAVAYAQFPPPPLIPPSLFSPPSSTPPPPPTPVFPFSLPAVTGMAPASIFTDFGRTATPPLPVHLLPPQPQTHAPPPPVEPANIGAAMTGTVPIVAQLAPTDGTLRPLQQPLQQEPANGQRPSPAETGPTGNVAPPAPTSPPPPPPAAPKRRGRPPKRRAETTDSATPSSGPDHVAAQPGPSASVSPSVRGQGAASTAPKRRGRPPKRRTATAPADLLTTSTAELIAADSTDAAPQPTSPEQIAPAPKRRGRPPKRRAVPALPDTATDAAELIATDWTATALPPTPPEQPPQSAPKRRGRPPKRAASPAVSDNAAASVPESTSAAQEDAAGADPVPVSTPGVRRSARVRKCSEQAGSVTVVNGVRPSEDAPGGTELVAPPAKRRRRASTALDDSAAREPDRSVQYPDSNRAVVLSPQGESRPSLSDLLGRGPAASVAPPPPASAGTVDFAPGPHFVVQSGIVPPPLTPLAMVSRPPTVVNSPVLGHADVASVASPGLGFTSVPAPRHFDGMSLGGEGSRSASVNGVSGPTTLAVLLGVMGHSVPLATSEST